jgi:hypothetical protein
MRMGDQVRDLQFGRVEEGDRGRVLWMGFLVNGEPTQLKVRRYKNKCKKIENIFCTVYLVGIEDRRVHKIIMRKNGK